MRMNNLPVAKRVQILSMLCEGSSMRSISRVADVSINIDSTMMILQLPHSHGILLLSANQYIGGWLAPRRLENTTKWRIYCRFAADRTKGKRRLSD